jgi:NADH-quinone oxidoreductase subunit H
MTFALFFLAEYSHIILMSLLTALLFLGAWLPPMDIFPFNMVPSAIWLSLKTALVMFGFIWVRATFPRMRYDALMALLWKGYLPLSLGFVWLVTGL